VLNENYRFWGGCYDNSRYIYLAPYYNETNTEYSADLFRFDTLGFFDNNDTWIPTTSSDFITGSNIKNAVVSTDPSTDEFYMLCENIVNNGYSIRYDKETTTFDLTPYLATDKDMLIERAIDGRPAALTFYLANGHLFDEANIDSLYSQYLEKGSKISIRLGEEISSTEYWQNQGTFYVRDKNISYKRGSMPIMTVHCEDIKSVLEDMELITTDNYDEYYPETIIEDLLENKASIDSGDVDIDTMDNRTYLYTAWTNEKITDILTAICDRFGYFTRVDVDGDFTIKKINEFASVDHAYTSKAHYIEYIPDSNFSDYVNQIIRKNILKN